MIGSPTARMSYDNHDAFIGNLKIGTLSTIAEDSTQTGPVVTSTGACSYFAFLLHKNYPP